ncbi:hypothetical protein K378_04532 [Streptomyces sp. Amel2xB2]|nr:hypothetical protein K378_04532 [Streptomyces sp. Amel2xB2]
MPGAAPAQQDGGPAEAAGDAVRADAVQAERTPPGASWTESAEPDAEAPAEAEVESEAYEHATGHEHAPEGGHAPEDGHEAASGEAYETGTDAGEEAAPGAEDRTADEAEDADAAEEDDGPRPLGLHVEPTGHAPVDGQLRRLEDADHLAVSGHLEVYEDVHRGLREALSALDRPAPGPGPRPGNAPAPGHHGAPGHPGPRPAHVPGRS